MTCEEGRTTLSSLCLSLKRKWDLRERQSATDSHKRSRSYCYLNFQQDWGLGITSVDSVAEREFKASGRVNDSLTRGTAVGAERVCCDGKRFFHLPCWWWLLKALEPAHVPWNPPVIRTTSWRVAKEGWKHEKLFAEDLAVQVDDGTRRTIGFKRECLWWICRSP